MGKFDGFLICSDIDGTFRGESGVDTVSANGKAVKYFTENGGRFTFVTGRMMPHIIQSGFAGFINAPACLCNGGVVYDYQTKQLLREKRLDFTVRDFVKAMGKNLCGNKGFSIRNSFLCNNHLDESMELLDFGELPAEVLDTKPIKLVCTFATPEEADRFKRFALEQALFADSYISKSWSVGVEFNPLDGTKGCALDFIKNYIGGIHTAVGVGDYENDIPLLQHADLGIAVGDAVEALKRHADLVVKPCEEFAIQDVIEILDSKV